MNLVVILLLISNCFFVYSQKIDPHELKCLVCRQSVKSLENEVNSLDPSAKVDVGGYRLDADGNYNHKSVPQKKSELKLAEIIENVCEKMDDFVRARRKEDGTLILFKLMTDDGKMNPLMGEVDIIQDDDLNKSLKYYCEEIMEIYEEDLIKFYQEDEENVENKLCSELSNYCSGFDRDEL